MGILGMLGANAQTVDINFQDAALQDGQDIGNFYSAQGVTFTGASLLVAQLDLNEIQFPPVTGGTNAVIDTSGPIVLTFSQAISSFSGYFTYTEPLTVDGIDATGNTVATAQSQYSANYLNPDGVSDITPGATANELISLDYAAGFTSVTLNGDPNGGDFILSDLSFTFAAPVTMVPEIDAGAGRLAGALLLGVLLLAAERRRRRPRPG